MTNSIVHFGVEHLIRRISDSHSNHVRHNTNTRTHLCAGRHAWNKCMIVCVLLVLYVAVCLREPFCLFLKCQMRYSQTNLKMFSIFAGTFWISEKDKR